MMKRFPLPVTALAVLLTGITIMGMPHITYAQTDSGQCSYLAAAANDGWGFNPFTGVSCPPLPLSDEPLNNEPLTNNCSYQYAAENQGWGYDESTGLSCPPLVSNASAGTLLVLQLRGKGKAEERTFDTTGDGVPDTTAPCFDAAIFDPSTGLQIGNGSDCLDVESNDDGNIRLTGYGFFELEGGTLVVQGNTTVRPVLQATVRDGVTFTHITGANGDNGVLYGDGVFWGATGGVRLSGQVDMSQLLVANEIYFDCLFIVEFN